MHMAQESLMQGDMSETNRKLARMQYIVQC